MVARSQNRAGKKPKNRRSDLQAQEEKKDGRGQNTHLQDHLESDEEGQDEEEDGDQESQGE